MKGEIIWNLEINQTAPDIIQAKKLAQIFKISLDEMLDNDIQNVIIEKLNNTEKTTNKATKILKIIGIVIIVCLTILIISTNLFLIKTKKSINELKQYEEAFDPYELIHYTTIKFKLNECEFIYDFWFNESSNGVWYFPQMLLTDIIGESSSKDRELAFHFSNLELVKKYGMEPLKALDYVKNSFIERGATYEVLEEKVGNYEEIWGKIYENN